MLLTYGILTLTTVVLFTIADRLTQAGLCGLWSAYTYTLWQVVP